MPDITMCSNDKCPFRYECRRHRASGTKPDEYWQSEFKPNPKTPKKKKDCEYFLERRM